MQELINLIKINIIKIVFCCCLIFSHSQESLAALNEKIVATIGGEAVITSGDLENAISLHILLSNAEKEIKNHRLRMQIKPGILRGLVDEKLILYYIKKNHQNSFSDDSMSYYRGNYIKTIEGRLKLKNIDFYSYCSRFKIPKNAINDKINAMIIVDLLSKGLQKKRIVANKFEKIDEFLKERKMIKNKQNIKYAENEISYQPTEDEVEYAKNNIAKYENKSNREIQNAIVNRDLNLIKTDLLTYIRRLYHVDIHEDFI